MTTSRKKSTDDYQSFDSDAGSDATATGDDDVVQHLFFTKRQMGLHFEENDDGSFSIGEVEEGTQAFDLLVKVGQTLVSINGKPPPNGVDGLSECFKRCMKKNTMMLGFSQPSLFRAARRPSLNLYQYEIKSTVPMKNNT